MRPPFDMTPEEIEETIEAIKAAPTEKLKEYIEFVRKYGRGNPPKEEKPEDYTTEEDIDAGNNLYDLCLQAETREEFIDYLDAVDAVAFLKKPVRVILTLMEDGDPVKERAIHFNIIRKKEGQ